MGTELILVLGSLEKRPTSALKLSANMLCKDQRSIDAFAAHLNVPKRVFKATGGGFEPATFARPPAEPRGNSRMFPQNKHTHPLIAFWVVLSPAAVGDPRGVANHRFLPGGGGSPTVARAGGWQPPGGRQPPPGQGNQTRAFHRLLPMVSSSLVASPISAARPLEAKGPRSGDSTKNKPYYWTVIGGALPGRALTRLFSLSFFGVLWLWGVRWVPGGVWRQSRAEHRLV